MTTGKVAAAGVALAAAAVVAAPVAVGAVIGGAIVTTGKLVLVSTILTIGGAAAGGFTNAQKAGFSNGDAIKEAAKAATFQGGFELIKQATGVGPFVGVLVDEVTSRVNDSIHKISLKNKK